MGQYYKIVNLDKKEYYSPWDFGEGAKLLEFSRDSDGSMTALAILLAESNNRGGGDLRSEHPVIGSWCGDRIVIAGDYADPNGNNLYDKCKNDNFYNISEKLKEAFKDDYDLKKSLKLKAKFIGNIKSRTNDE